MIKYEAVSTTGEKIEGRFSGSKDELIKYLKSENYILVSLNEENRKSLQKKFKLEDVYLNLEQIYYLLNAGLKIDKAINTLIKNLDNQGLIEFWENVLAHLKTGKQFSKAVQEVSKEKNLNIPQFYINTFAVGESVGDLKSSLKVVLEDIEFKKNLKKEIKSALSYPLFLIIMSILTILIVVGFILPKFTQIFTPEEINKLPFLSYIVIKFGVLLKDNIMIIIFLTLLSLIGIIFVFNNTKRRKIFSLILYKLPYIKDILLKVELSNVFLSLSTMLKGGLYLIEAINFTKSITNHPTLKNILEELQIELKKGKKISQVLNNYPIIPYDTIVLISVGEESGNLEDILEKLGKKYILEFKDKIAKLLSFLEPIVIIIVGLFIGFIVTAILLAVLSISDVL